MKLSLTIAGAILLALAPAATVAAETAGTPPSARVDNAKIFPYFAAGGAWETTILLINLADDSSTDYTMTFWGDNGQATQVDYRAPDGTIGQAHEIEGRLADDATDRYTLLDVGLLKTGWVRIDYDGDNKIGGTLIFRQRAAGRPDFETSVPLVRDDETTWWAPFDNTENFATTVAMTNPSSGDTTTLQIRFWDYSGSEITTKEVSLQPGRTTAFSIRELYPELNNRRGQFRVQGSGNRLSSIVLRFNPDGAFNTIPVASR